MKNNCPDCEYLFQERAAIHQFDGKATRQEAERLAASESCERHKPHSRESGSEAKRFFNAALE